jgi:AraC-like DNA-binding protein
VTGSRYFFLDLSPPSGRSWSLALGGRETCAPDYVIERSRYAYHVLEYVAEGRGEVTLDGHTSSLEAGDLFTYAPHTRIRLSTDPRQPMIKFFFALSGKAAAKALAKAALPPGSVRHLAAHAEIRSVAEELVREGGHGSPFAEGICRSYMEILLLKISDSGAWSRHVDPLARENFLRCKALIDAHVERVASLSQLSAEAGLDVSTICRLFKRFQGTSPYQYLLRKKMNLAAEKLVDTGCLVKEAAQWVGFADQFHFARCFKAIHGVPPSTLRGLGRPDSA